MASKPNIHVARLLLAAGISTLSLGQGTAWAESSDLGKPATQINPSEEAAKATRIWRVKATDRNVREILSRWSTEAGWQLSWEVPNDVELHATASFQGSFEDALEQLLNSLQGSDYPLSACTYDNHVVRVVTSTLICDRKAP